jgi:hypothetical protein
LNAEKCSTLPTAFPPPATARPDSFQYPSVSSYDHIGMSGGAAAAIVVGSTISISAVAPRARLNLVPAPSTKSTKPAP